MKERLTKLIKEAQERYIYAEEQAQYLIDNGVIVPPCKVGDTVYPLYADRRFRAIIEKIEINANELLFYWVQYDVGVDCTECWDEDLFTVGDIGKTVFIDEVEYLIALKGGAENG